MTHRTQLGVTLLELLIVVAIAGILASIGAPSMSEFVHNNRLKAARSQLVSDLNLARSEAVKRNARVLVCASNTATTDCANATNWGTTGWLVCVDSDANGVCDASTTNIPNPIQIKKAPHNTLSITGPNVAIRFNPIGSQGAVGNAGVNITISGTWSGATSNTVSVAGTGNVTSN